MSLTKKKKKKKRKKADRKETSVRRAEAMKLSFLVSVALALCLSSTGLFLAGLVEPHWLEGHDVNGAFYYGPFLFCQHGDCFAWSDMQTKDDETDRRLLGPKRHLPGGLCVCVYVLARVRVVTFFERARLCGKTTRPEPRSWLVSCQSPGAD